MGARKAVVRYLGGLGLDWPRPVRHPHLPELPDHVPVLVHGYADPVNVPWVALHGERLFGVAGERLTPKHHRPLREVYRLGPLTRIAIEFYVDDRVLEGLWRNRPLVVAQLRQLGVDLVLTPNFSVWVKGTPTAFLFSRFSMSRLLKTQRLWKPRRLLRSVPRKTQTWIPTC